MKRLATAIALLIITSQSANAALVHVEDSFWANETNLQMGTETLDQETLFDFDGDFAATLTTGLISDGSLGLSRAGGSWNGQTLSTFGSISYATPSSELGVILSAVRVNLTFVVGDQPVVFRRFEDASFAPSLLDLELFYLLTDTELGPIFGSFADNVVLTPGRRYNFNAISFINNGSVADFNAMFRSGFTLQAVPSPSSLFLLLGGLLGMRISRRIKS